MSVLIKGANIPVMGCLFCQLRNGDDCVASDILDVSEQVYKSTRERHPDCPFVEVPTPHGRLIDADRLMEVIEKNSYLLKSYYNSLENGMFLTGIKQAINEAPTIIEAEANE